MYARTAERRPLGAMGRMGIVVGMHAALLFLVARSTGIVQSKPFMPEPIHPPAEDAKPIEPPPPVEYHPEQFKHQEQWVAPVIDTTQSTDGGDIALDPPAGPDIDAGSGDIMPPPAMESARIDARHPLSQPLYPPLERRLGNEGSADMEIYVLPNGSVGDARILKSTGFPALDNAALEEARRKWHLIPATKNGEAIPSWYRLRIVFKLKNG